MRLNELELPKRKIRQIEKINNRKEMSRSIGPDYQQQPLEIELKELKKIIKNTLKHLTMCDCVNRFKDQSIIYV